MSMLRKAKFLMLEDSLSFAHMTDNGSKGLHDAFPFCKSSCSWLLELLYHMVLGLSFNLWLKLFLKTVRSMGPNLRGVLRGMQRSLREQIPLPRLNNG